MKRAGKGKKGQVKGPTQRQLRAGELVRHALADILRQGDVHDEALAAASVVVSEVRLSPDFRHAVCFVQPLGGAHAVQTVAALNRHARFLRGRLGHEIDLKFTPELKFVHDQSFEEASRMDAVFRRPEVSRDLSSPLGGSPREAGDGGDAALPSDGDDS